MRFIFIPLPPNLPSRWYQVHSKRAKELKRKRTHKSRAAYIKKHEIWRLLKRWLVSISGDKCWYCEAKSGRATFDVDHFRPKLRVTVDGAVLVGHGGYYWLAYEWPNFRLSCQRCNRPEKSDAGTRYGKWDEFPLQDEAHRCMTPGQNLSDEFPRLLDPCVLDDCALLAHGIDGEVKPAVQDNSSWAYLRAEYTITRLGFNEWNTPESKRGNWQTLAALLNAVGNAPTQDTIDVIKNHLDHNHEYSSFFRSAIGTHRDKAWVEALL